MYQRTKSSTKLRALCIDVQTKILWLQSKASVLFTNELVVYIKPSAIDLDFDSVVIELSKVQPGEVGDNKVATGIETVVIENVG